MRLSNPFVISNTPTRHEIETDEGTLVVWIKPLSWVEQQEALTNFVEFNMDGEDITPNLDFGGYWRYVLGKCITKTEPSMKKSELAQLKPEVGQKLQSVLPSLTELMESLGGEASPLG